MDDKIFRKNSFSERTKNVSFRIGEDFSNYYGTRNVSIKERTVLNDLKSRLAFIKIKYFLIV